MGAFDDLIPPAPASRGLFDDLIPAEQSVSEDLVSGDPLRIASGQQELAAKVLHMTNVGLSTGDVVEAKRRVQEAINRQMPSINPRPVFGKNQYSREMQPRQALPSDAELAVDADARDQAAEEQAQAAAAAAHPFNKTASVIGPIAHGGIELSKRVAQDWADDTAALLRGEPIPKTTGNGLHIPGMRNVSAFANNPHAPSPSAQENPTIGKGMRALQAAGEMGATLPVFIGATVAGGPAAIPAILGTTPEGEVDPVGLVIGLTIGRVHQGAAKWLKSKFFADTVQKLAPQEMRAMYQRLAAGQATAEDQALLVKINELKTKGQSLRDLQRQGGTLTVPWAQNPTQAQIEKLATQLGGIGAANGYFLTLQMPQILASDDPNQALLESVAGLAAASVPGLTALAGKPGRHGKGTLDVNGRPETPKSPMPGSSGAKPNLLQLKSPEPRGAFDDLIPEKISQSQPPESSRNSELGLHTGTTPPAAVAATSPGAGASGVPNLVQRAVTAAQESGTVQGIEQARVETEQRAAQQAAGKPYTKEQALADLPTVMADMRAQLANLEATIKGNQLKPAENNNLPQNQGNSPEIAPPADLESNKPETTLKVGDRIAATERDEEGFASDVQPAVSKQLDSLPVGSQVVHKFTGNVFEKHKSGEWRHRPDIQRAGNAIQDAGTATHAGLARAEIIQVGPTSTPAQKTPQVAKPVTAESPSFTAGQTVAVRLSNRSSKEHLGKIIQLQPDGSATVQLHGEKTYRTLRKDQFQLSKTDAARAAKAEEIASVPAEQQAQVKADAAEFAQIVEDYAPLLEWAPAEAYDRNTVMQEQGIQNARLRAKAIDRAMRAVLPEGQGNSLIDRARALPRLVEYLQQQFPGDNSIAKRRALEEFGRSEPEAPTSTEQRTAAKQDAAHLRRLAAQNPGVPELRNLVVHSTAGRVAPAGSTGQLGGNPGRKSRITASEQKALRELDRIFGTRTIIVDSPGQTIPFNGFRDRSSNVVLIHARTDYPVLVVAGHELLHHIRLTHPHLYEEMRAALWPLLQNTADFKLRLERRGQGKADWQEELLGDFLGDNFGRQEFWEDLKRREPNLFKRLARIVKAWLDKLIAKLKGEQPKSFASDQYFTDLEHARHVVGTALVEAARETQYRRAGVPVDVTPFEAGNATITSPGDITIGGEPLFSLTAHHGTPHKVDKFTTDKIGTGEGAQVYGWGLYFAENDKVAEDYKKNLTEREFISKVRELYDEFSSPEDALAAINAPENKFSEGQRRLLDALQKEDWLGFDYPHQAVQAAIREPENVLVDAPETRAALNTFGNKYTVSLNVEPEELLDWDKPLSEQSSKVIGVLAPVVERMRAEMRRTLSPENFKAWSSRTEDLDTNTIYTWLSRENGIPIQETKSWTQVTSQMFRGDEMVGKDENASKYLSRLGIKGIRYLDQGSRGKTRWIAKHPQGGENDFADQKSAEAFITRNPEYKLIPPEQTYNYVIFNGDDITITHENGHEVGAAALFSKPEGNDLFGAPESVEEQRARIKAEAETQKLKKAKEAMQERAGARLTAADIDTTQEMFGGADARSTRQDKTGQGSLFSKPEGEPSPGNDWQQLKQELQAAEAQMLEAIRNAGNPARSIPKAEAEQAKALATARVRELQERLASHPDRYSNLSLNELDAKAAEVTDRLREIQNTPSDPGNLLAGELRGERYQLLKDARAIKREKLTRPEYVAQVLKRSEALTKELRAAKSSGDTTAARHAVEDLMELQDGELGHMNPQLIESVRKNLVARGELEALTPASNRTLGDLTAWLKANKIESPRLSLKDRVNLGKRLADEFAAGKTKLEHATARARSVWQAFKAQWRAPKQDDEPRAIFKEWHYEKQFSGLETHQWIQRIRADIPQKVRRMAISVWLDADGDKGLLTFQRDAVPARYQAVWDAALKLTPTEQAFARQIKQDFESKLADGQLMGLIGKGRENYGVPQIWAKAPEHGANYRPDATGPRTARNPLAKLDPRDPFFALERTHESYFDGIMANGMPKSLDIADLVGVYNVDFHGALADRSVIKALKDAKLPDGSPAVMVSGGAKIEMLPNGARTQFVDSNWRPKDAVTQDGRPYQTIDHWALRGWTFAAKDTAGNPIMVKGDFLVHPDLYRALKTQLEGKSALRDPDGPLGDIAHLTKFMLESGAFLKASKFAAATFHGATLAEHMMTHAFSGMPSKERLTLLNPFVFGVEVDPAKNLELANLMRHGMDLGFGGARMLFEEGLSSHGGILSKVPGLGDGLAWLSNGLFQEYLPRLKVRMGSVVLHANLKRYSKPSLSGPALTEQQIYELTASQVNAAFGGQNWKLMGRSRTFLDVNRLLFTAPDFLLSRAKVVGQAGKPYNAEQRYFLIAQAALVYALARILNYLLDDDPHWEAENALRVIHKNRAYSARFIVNDIGHLLQDPAGFAGGRLGPWPKALYESITGRDMRSGARIDVPIQTDNGALRATQILLKDLAMWGLPIGTEGFLPGATGREQTTLGQFGVGLLGVGSQRFTPETEMYRAAAEFNRKSTDPKTLLHQQTRDEAVKETSVYRKLDVLLEAEDYAAARKEYQSLLADGRTADGIKNRYKAMSKGHLARPFSGSQEREKQFKASLTPEELREYQRAIELRKQREQAFQKMLKAPR
jgi:hypothetical protein